MFWMQTLTPVERLDKLVFAGTLRPLEDGFGMYCYVCRTTIRTHAAFDNSHDWFSDCADQYYEHVSAECDKRVKEGALVSEMEEAFMRSAGGSPGRIRLIEAAREYHAAVRRQHLPIWRMNAAGFMAFTADAHDLFTMREFDDTPIFEECVLSTNWRAYKRERDGG